MRRYLVAELDFNILAGGSGDLDASYYQTDDIDEADRLAHNLHEHSIGGDGHRVTVHVIDTTTTGWFQDATDKLRDLKAEEDEWSS